jgi:hypothetical protein
MPLRASPSRKARASWFCVLLFIPACSRPQDATTEARPEPIAECQQYEQAVSRCTGRTLALPYAAAPTGKSEQEVEQLRQLCATNLQRLNEACR